MFITSTRETAFSTCNIRTQLSVNSKPVTEYLYPDAYHAVFIPGIFFLGGGFLHRNLQSPPKRQPNCAKLFVIKQSKGCKFMPKTRLAAGAKNVLRSRS